MNGTYDLAYIDVNYSDASGGRTMYAVNTTDGGNNINWIFTGAAITWLGLESSDWDTAGNWDLDRTPTAADDVVINLTGTVNLPSSTTINSLILGNEGGTTNPVLTFTYNGIANGALIIDDGNLTVHTGANITQSAGTTLVVGTVNLDIQTGGATINGTINVDSTGYQHSEGTGAGTNASGGGSGAGYGGDGGYGNGISGGSAYGSITEPINIGSGGGDASDYGGAGGGAVKLTIAGTATIAGTISSNGGTGQEGAGGGSGGSVYITTGTLAGDGTIIANGGNGYNSVCGGGSGGRIAMHYTTDSSTVSYEAYGGLAGASTTRMGGAGTIYTKAVAQSNGDLTLDNNNQDRLNDSYIGKTPIDETITFDTLTIQNYGNLETGSSTNITYTTLDWSTKGTITDIGGTFDLLSGGGALTVPATSRLYAYTSRTYTSCAVNGYMEARHAITTAGDFNIGVVGTLTTEYNTTVKQYVIDITAANFNLSSGGTINVNARGYQHSAGTGAGTNGTRAGGAGYGGDGGDGNAGSGGGAYGSITEPTDLGSGGGDSGTGGAGGGAVKLAIAGTTTIAGTISSNGGNGGSDAGGGSGGSVYIMTGTLTGAGTITANGGTGEDSYAGGGGGGRIAVYYTTDSSTVSYEAHGGLAGASTSRMGGAGTIYTKASTQGNGDLMIDNNNQDSLGDTAIGRTPIDETIAFDTITIQNYGNLETRTFTDITYTTLD
ncbi:MAG: hypothetical protein KAS59_09965, partial [Alphaproteobacteria bacterium]|nr:hypothetical protein [Alphaproteobacteria bacterium]